MMMMMSLHFLLLSLLLVHGVHSRRDPMRESIKQLTADNDEGGNNWAVLVAGSNTYSNYRHQADICHAYQIIKDHGLSDERIIVMMYDDIAFNPQNPRKGEIINRIGGPDVYKGVPKDYTRGDVTASNFLKILTGQAMDVGSGKTLNSTEKDNVFIYYADHGASGLVAMPTGDYLYASDLQAALTTMKEAKMYNKLVFYLEACESGSMFLDLPTDMEIYATTASSPIESSYACYFEPTLSTYVGDCYSVNWMENTDNVNLKREDLEEQYHVVKARTTESEVCQYGAMNFSSDSLSVFLAGGGRGNSHRVRRGDDARGRGGQPDVPMTPLDSRDVKLKYLSSKLAQATTQEEFDDWSQQLSEEVRMRDAADRTFRIISVALQNAATSPIALGPECLKQVVKGTEERCGDFSDYSLKYVRVLHDACRAGIPIQDTLAIVSKVCPMHP